MSTSRKKFIKQTAFAAASMCLPFSKLFAKESALHKAPLHLILIIRSNA